MIQPMVSIRDFEIHTYIIYFVSDANLTSNYESANLKTNCNYDNYENDALLFIKEEEPDELEAILNAIKEEENNSCQ